MREASEAWKAAVVAIPLALLLLPFLLSPADLVVQLGLPVYVPRSLSVRQKRERGLQRHDANMTSAPTLPGASNRSNWGGYKGDFQKASLMPGYDSLFTFMFEALLQYFQFSLE